MFLPSARKLASVRNTPAIYRKNVALTRVTIPSPVTEELENCIYEFLPAGFEINDGGQGTLLIETQMAKVTIQHQENYTESRDSTQEFTL